MNNPALAALLIVALGLRLWGIDWGLPNDLHALSYHTDETVLLMHSTTIFPGGLNIFAGSLLPHFYNYGSLQLMLINIAVSIVSTYTHSFDRGQMLFEAYVTGRVLTAFMGTATVWALWAFARRMYGESVGLLSALLLALTPLHAQHSHFVTVDVPATLWVTITLVYCAKALKEDRPIRDIITAGLFAGLAAATKYNCALVLLPVLYTAVGREGQTRSLKAAGAAAAIAAFAAAFLAGCPGCLLDSSLFARDVAFEAVHVSSQQELWFLGTGPGWVYIVTRNLFDGEGPFLWAVAIVGACYLKPRKQPGDLLTLLFAAPYFLLVGAAVSRYARYEIPLLPILAVWAARFLVDVAQYRREWEGINNARLGWLPAGVVTLATVVSALFLLYPMSQTDPRDRAMEWINAHVAASEKIAMPVEPWFWSPPISRFFSFPGANGQWTRLPGGKAAAARVLPNYDSARPPIPFDVTTLTADQPPVVVMSEYEYFDRLRLHDPAATAYVNQLKAQYDRPIVFADVHWLGGRTSIDGLPCQDLPHDMLYTSPTVLVFVRRSVAE